MEEKSFLKIVNSGEKNVLPFPLNLNLFWDQCYKTFLRPKFTNAHFNKLECFFLARLLLPGLILASRSGLTFWDQCYKTFFVRDLQIFIQS